MSESHGDNSGNGGEANGASGDTSSARMRLENWTPHPLTIVGTPALMLAPSGEAPPRVRIDSFPEPPIEIGGRVIEVVAQRGGVVVGLPATRPGVLLVVAQMVASAAPERRDLVFPADLVRDAAGNVVGCRKLGRVCDSK